MMVEGITFRSLVNYSRLLLLLDFAEIVATILFFFGLELLWAPDGFSAKSAAFVWQDLHLLVHRWQLFGLFRLLVLLMDAAEEGSSLLLGHAQLVAVLFLSHLWHLRVRNKQNREVINLHFAEFVCEKTF